MGDVCRFFPSTLYFFRYPSRQFKRRWSRSIVGWKNYIRNTLYYTREVGAKRRRRIIMADNESRAVLKLCTKFDGRDKASFREYQDKRVILSRHHNAAAEVLQGRERPTRTVIGDDPSNHDTAQLHWLGIAQTMTCSASCFLLPKNKRTTPLDILRGKHRRMELVIAKQRGQR